MTNDRSFQDAGLEAMLDFSFRRFITLSVIKIVYGLGLAVIALGWLIGVVGAMIQGGALAGVAVLLLGTLAALLYMIFFRIWLELIVVMFRIGENTSKLVENAGMQPAGDAPERM